MTQYWVIESNPQETVTIHKDSCQHSGAGKDQKRQGPFGYYQDALTTAMSTGKLKGPSTLNCPHCSPP